MAEFLRANYFLNSYQPISSIFRTQSRASSTRLIQQPIHKSAQAERCSAAIREHRASTPSFEQIPFTLRGSYLYDLGVADINNDGIFDIFSTNHNSQENLLLGSTSGQFTDVLNQWGLAQDERFPGLGDFSFTPPPNQPGLFIYRQDDTRLNLRFQPGNSIHKVHGNIVFPSPDISSASIKIIKRDRATAQINRTPLQQGSQTRVQFTLKPGGHLVLDTRFSEISYTFQLAKPLPLQQVYISSLQDHPKQRQFTLHLHDRHGMAWADSQGDGQIDLFMSRGGLRGQILSFPNSTAIRDELFINQGNGVFKDRATQLGFSKQGCRARKVTWVDFNGDDRLDLYIRGKRSPNELFQQLPNGHFKNVAANLGLNFRDASTFEWLDVDHDRDQDLLIARKGKLELCLNQNGHFKQHQIIRAPGATFKKFAIADYDQDDDLDVYAASPQSSLLLINQNGRYVATNPASIGLPVRGLTANWVDYDNDGFIDLHVLPGVLYRQTANHQFIKTQLLDNLLPDTVVQSEQDAISDARAIWFDLDNNGTRDLLYAGHSLSPLNVALYRNLMTQNHWLELNLVGTPGNRQAIGAQAVVTTATGQQLQQVGMAEGSHESQGHYRLYFGLGQNTTASVQILWPNGKQQILPSVGGDRLLTVQYAPT